MTITEELPTSSCTCSFDGDADMHNRMLSFESLPPAEAAFLVAEFILGETVVIVSSSAFGSGDPSDFQQFVMQHNWEDRVAMSQLAGYVNPSAHRVHEHDRRQRG